MATTSSVTNSSGITVGSDGKVKVSGYSSGIDWQSLIDAEIKAKSTQATTLKTKISDNKTKISAYNEFKSKVSDFSTALKALSGSPTSTDSVFSAKSVTGTSALASDAPVGTTASSVSDMLVVSTSTTAQNATHTIKVRQLATTNQIRTDAVSSTSTALSTLGYTTGTFTINGKDISVSSTDSLLDVKSRINNAGAGVTATIVSSSSGSNYLILTADKTGVSNAITIGGSTAVTNALGLTQTVDVNGTPTTSVKTTLVEAKDAIVDVDGITGITRSSNSISDIIDGVTLSLQKADANTVITLKVEPDLASVQTAISDFVDAYNAVRAYVDDQRSNKDWNDDGTTAENEYGPLAYDQTVRDALSRMSSMASAVVGSNTDGFKSLSQIGVVMNKDYTLTVDNTILDSKLLSNVGAIQKLFGLNTTTSDSRVLVTSAGSAISGTYYLNIAGTDASGNVTSANISKNSGDMSGNTNGTSDGTVTVNSASGKLMTVTDESLAEGLGLYFGGGANLGNVSGIVVTVSRGIADEGYDYFNNMIKDTTGTMDTLVSTLTEQDGKYQDQIDTINTRMETYRTTLTAKYTAMETALAKLSTLKDTISNYYDSMNSSNN
jgi:flagellar hook-associated protein 2